MDVLPVTVTLDHLNVVAGFCCHVEIRLIFPTLGKSIGDSNVAFALGKLRANRRLAPLMGVLDPAGVKLVNAVDHEIHISLEVSVWAEFAGKSGFAGAWKATNDVEDVFHLRREEEIVEKICGASSFLVGSGRRRKWERE